MAALATDDTRECWFVLKVVTVVFATHSTYILEEDV
jgi:hypothetical protein